MKINKILYVYQKDPNDPKTQSGRPQSILKAFKEKGHEVKTIRLDSWVYRVILVILKILCRLRLRKGDPTRSAALAFISIPKIRSEIHKFGPQMIFSPSTIALNYVKKSENYLRVACADTLVPGLYEFYNVGKKYDLVSDMRSEARALQCCDYIVVPTVWAEKQVEQMHLRFKPKVIVSPFGANLPNVPSCEQVERMIAARLKMHEINLVTVVSDWERKGGVLMACLANTLALKIPHLKIKLHIIGSIDNDKVSAQFSSAVQLRYLGVIDKSNSADMQSFYSVFSESHLFLMPSLGEAYGMAMCEASAFGLPLIGSSNGGIKELIAHGKNGWYLDNIADVPDVVEKIICLISDQDAYTVFCRNSRMRFDTQLNWRAFYLNTFMQLV